MEMLEENSVRFKLENNKNKKTDEPLHGNNAAKI